MRIDPEDLRRRYAVMSDEELLSIDANELSPMARPLFEQELHSRQLSGDQEEPEVETRNDAAAPLPHLEIDLDDEGDETPEWLEEAACVCTFAVDHASADAPGALRARDVLRAAHVPCHLSLIQDRPATRHEPARHAVLLMVPNSLILPATSILDRDVLNAEHEVEWRTHLEGLSDDELQALDPDILCAGLLDRAARLRKAYAEERAIRQL